MWVQEEKQVLLFWKRILLEHFQQCYRLEENHVVVCLWLICRSNHSWNRRQVLRVSKQTNQRWWQSDEQDDNDDNNSTTKKEQELHPPLPITNPINPVPPLHSQPQRQWQPTPQSRISAASLETEIPFLPVSLNQPRAYELPVGWHGITMNMKLWMVYLKPCRKWRSRIPGDCTPQVPQFLYKAGVNGATTTTPSNNSSEQDKKRLALHHWAWRRHTRTQVPPIHHLMVSHNPVELAKSIANGVCLLKSGKRQWTINP